MMKSRLIILVLASMMNSNVTHADYDASSLHKLFTDKKQRAQIDAARSGNYSGADAQKTNHIKVSGYVTRSDGKGVVWLNNKSTLHGPKLGDVRVRQSSIGKDKKVSLTVNGTPVRLKPGETWSEDAGISDPIN